MLRPHLLTVIESGLMHRIGQTLIEIVTTMFLVGLTGSAVVVLISFVEDFRELFHSDD